MITINANTRIGTILREHPAALDTIIGISPKFTRLRNPVLRKLMAGRTTIAMASRIGGCTVDDFFVRLASLGFIVDREGQDSRTNGDGPAGEMDLPAFLETLDPEKLIELDVRPILAAGKDPLADILASIQNLGPDMILRIVNTFEPTPLLSLLGKKGYGSSVDRVDGHLVHTYFYSRNSHPSIAPVAGPQPGGDWDQLIRRFIGRLVPIDVRDLPMPRPMTTILENLEHLSPGHALFVEHKRIPVFLLPELADRGFTHRIHEVGEGHIQLLIFKDANA